MTRPLLEPDLDPGPVSHSWSNGRSVDVGDVEPEVSPDESGSQPQYRPSPAQSPDEVTTLTLTPKPDLTTKPCMVRYGYGGYGLFRTGTVQFSQDGTMI